MATLADRITTVLTAAGFKDGRDIPSFLPDGGFTVTEGVGATVGTYWVNATREQRAELLGKFAAVLRADGLRVDVRDGYLYVYDPARGATDG